MAGRRRPRRVARALLAVVVAVALLVVVADRALAWYVEREAETAIQSAGARGVQVSIRGFPFLTQVASGNLDRMAGQIDSGTFAGYDVADISIDARDVAPRAPYVAQSVRADGLLGLESVQQAMSESVGADVRVDPSDEESDGDRALALVIPVAGLDVAVTVVPTAADAATLGVDVREVAVGGVSVDVDTLPGAVANLLTGLDVPLDLPDGVELAGASVEPGGLRIELDAADLPLADLAATGQPGAESGGEAP